MKEEWYEILLRDLADFGTKEFSEMVEDGEYPTAARKVLKPTEEMWGWENFKLIHEIFTEAYV